MEKKITKSLKTTVNDVTEKGIVTIGITQFDDFDSDNDRLLSGSLTKTWTESKQVHLIDHQKGMSTYVGLPVAKDPKTGIVESQLNLNKQVGRDLLEDYKFSQQHGRSLQHSHGFMAVAGKFSKNEKGGRDFAEIRQFEYSTLLFGAVSNTPLHGIKSDETIEDLISELELKLSFCGYSEEYGRLIETKVAELKAMIKEPQQHSNENNEPPIGTQQLKSFYSLIHS